MEAFEKKNATSNFACKAFFSSQNIIIDTWIVDIGAFNHMTGYKDLLHDLTNLDSAIKIGLPDGSFKIVKQLGGCTCFPILI